MLLKLKTKSSQFAKKPQSIAVLVFFVWLMDVFVVPLFKPSNEDMNEVEVSKQQPSLDDIKLAKDLPMVVLPKYVELPPPPSKPVTLEHMVSETPQLKASNEKNVQSSYEALSKLTEDSLSFILPSDKRERAKLLRFLYKCQHMQFGAVVNSSEQASLMLLSQSKNIATSKLLRVVHGDLSAEESRLLNVYAPDATPVRIFPEHIDMVLSAYISAALKDEALKQFQGEYSILGNSLFLKSIELNNQAISETWELAKSNCIV